jgi:hypothetical protein
MEKPKERKHSRPEKWSTSPKIRQEELSFEEEIGRGFFSIVKKGKCRGIPVAIKVTNLQIVYKCIRNLTPVTPLTPLY